MPPKKMAALSQRKGTGHRPKKGSSNSPLPSYILAEDALLATPSQNLYLDAHKAILKILNDLAPNDRSVHLDCLESLLQIISFPQGQSTVSRGTQTVVTELTPLAGSARKVDIPPPVRPLNTNCFMVKVNRDHTPVGRKNLISARKAKSRAVKKLLDFVRGMPETHEQRALVFFTFFCKCRLGQQLFHTISPCLKFGGADMIMANIKFMLSLAQEQSNTNQSRGFQKTMLMSLLSNSMSVNHLRYVRNYFGLSPRSFKRVATQAIAARMSVTTMTQHRKAQMQALKEWELHPHPKPPPTPHPMELKRYASSRW
jgi:hypothetical protein